MTEVSAGCRDLFFQGGCKIRTEVSASSQELPFCCVYLHRCAAAIAFIVRTSTHDSFDINMSQCRNRRCVECAAGADMLACTAFGTGCCSFDNDAECVIVFVDFLQLVDHLFFRCAAGAADTFLQAGCFRGGPDFCEPVVPPVSRRGGSTFCIGVAAFATGICRDPICRTGGGSRHSGCIGMGAGGIACARTSGTGAA